MVNNKKVVVVLPAYNAAKTLRQTVSEIPHHMVDEIILTDDASTDETVAIARELNIHHIVRHNKNAGYGGNQKTCYRKALEIGADIIVMLHPDYQYTPKLIPSMVGLIANGVYPVVLGSRILGGQALKGGMPLYKYVSNRALTFAQNIFLGAKLSEYHTGYRAFSADVLKRIDVDKNSDGYVFDNQFLSQVIYAGFEIGEITCPAKYFDDASSINFGNSIVYGLGVLKVSIQHFLQNSKLMHFDRYQLKP
jgi:glycosyltransferase involved in cell wall biosynthesis